MNAATDTALPEPRNPAVDLLRAGMVLYIVGWWHLLAHVGNGVSHVNWATDTLTNVVLGTFTFLSGYVLGTWRGQFDATSICKFYRRRFVRVYPLYLLALVLFVGVWLTDPFSAVKAALLLSMLWPEPPMTLWFITMIMVFYVVAPGLARPGLRGTLGLAASLWILLLAFDSWVNSIDARIVMFFPAFVAGVVWRRFGPVVFVGRLLLLALLFVLAFVFTRYKSALPMAAAVQSVPVVTIGALLALLVAERWGGALGAHSFVQWLSYTSFAAYLFHRVVFRQALRWYQPVDEAVQIAYLVALALPASLLIGYASQRIYDQCLARTALFGARSKRPGSA